MWVITVILSATCLSLFIFSITTNTVLGQISTCGSQMEIRDVQGLLGKNSLTVN